jgi:hypothetical protein
MVKFCFYSCPSPYNIGQYFPVCQTASALLPGCHVNIPRGKGYRYSSLLQGNVNGLVSLVQGLKILFGGTQ